MASHFSDKELACPHCGVNGTRLSLRLALEEIRRRVSAYRGVDTPVIIDSAYRCPEHNKAVGGASNSQHVEGIAADIRVAGMTAAELLAIVKDVPLVHGLGRADVQNYVHFDLRSQPAKWCYAKDGKVEPWYEPASAAKA